MNNVSSFNVELLILAYELRLADEPDDRYTLSLLGKIPPENLSPLMREIILANKKKHDGTDLEWCTFDRYKLLCGPDFSFVMKYQGGSPYAIHEEEPKDAQAKPSDWQMRVFNNLEKAMTYF